MTGPTAIAPPARRRRGRAATMSGVAAVACGVLLPLLLATGTARAEAPVFLGEVDRNQVVVGDPFVYQVTLSVGQEDEVSDYRPPDFKGLRVLSQPAGASQSTQMQIGGGGTFVQISYSWRYEVAALQKGGISIGPAHVRLNGRDFRSGLATVSVLSAGASSGPPPIAAAPAGPGAAATGAGPAGATGGDLPTEAFEGGSFIRVVTDKQKVFVGEAMSATWFLYFNQNFNNYDPQVEPHAEGFWTEDISVPTRRGGGLVISQEVVQGRAYQVGAIKKQALFPLQPGRLTITAMEADLLRSDFFQTRRQHVRSNATVVEVLPLPKAGQPAGFDSASVGKFTLAAHVDRAQVAVGEPVTLTIEAGGTGNVRKLSMPSVPKLDGWKAYEPRVNTVVDPSNGITGTKTAEILLVPESAGSIQVPPLVLASFDPQARQYVRVETPPIVLTATADGSGGARVATKGAAALAPGGAAFSENLIAAEIRPVHGKSILRRDLGTTFFRTRALVGFIVVPPLGFALMLFGFRMRDRLSEDTGSRRRRRARQKVRAHLASAEKCRQRGEAGAFFIEIDRVIREALTSRLGRPTKGLRLDELRALLGARGFDASRGDRVIALLEECDRGRFAPPGGGGGTQDVGRTVAALGTVLDEASDLIDAVEKAPLSPEAES